MLDENRLIGRRLGRYTITHLLGRGGMGVVYLAKEAVLERDVALKVLAERLASDASYVRRFEREAKAAARLAHPSIVRVLSVGGGENGEPHYIAMEFVKGRTLSGCIREDGAFEVKRALDIARQVADALGFAHEQGFIHRDIKPDNIMLDDAGRVRILDFGLAKGADSSRSITRAGMKLGTPAYMAPEQVHGADADARTDVYALGLTLFEMLAGRRAFDAPNGVALMYQIDRAPFPDILEFNRSVPPAVKALVERMAAKDPAKRYLSGGQAREAVEAVQGGGEAPASSGRPAQSGGELTGFDERVKARAPSGGGRLGRKRVLAALAVLAVVGVGVLIWALTLTDLGSWFEGSAEEVVEQGIEDREALVRAEAARLKAEAEAKAEAAKAAEEAAQRQAETAPGGEIERRIELAPDVFLDMVWIPPGEFMMGSPPGEFMRGTPEWVLRGREDERPQHKVTISKGFWMGKYEVTQAQWQAVRGSNRSKFKGDRNPVEGLIRGDCTVFFGELLLTKKLRWLRLPTEAEWEYACRAGSASSYCFGDDMRRLGDYAWFGANSGRKTHPVGQKKANAWGLYDMHGNVWEWCEDWYDSNYYVRSPSVDPAGPSSGTHGVLRGGDCGSDPRGCRSANRGGDAPGGRGSRLGFRVVLPVGQ